MKHKKYLISAICLTATSSLYAADPVPPPLPVSPQDLMPKASESDDVIRDNLQEIRKIETNLREDVAWSLQQHQNDQQTQTETTDSDGEKTCLAYEQVKIEGVTLLNQADFYRKLSGCINTHTLNQLSREIVAAYMKEGYINTQIDFVEQDNNLIIRVKESKIGKITGESRRVNTKMLFPNYQDKPLDVHRLDQGIEQANKVIGNNVSMDVYPQKDGSVSIALQNEESKPWFGSFTVDNKGSSRQPAVGRLQLGIGSPLGLSDNLYLGAYSNLDKDDGFYSRGANLFYTVPYGSLTFSTYAGLSNSQSTIQASGRKYAYDSESISAGLKGEKVISRGGKHITSMYAGIDYIDTTQEFAGSRINMQSPRLSAVSTGISHSQMLKKGVWITDVRAEHGTRLFGATDRANSPFDTIYSRYLLESDLMQSHRAGKWLIRNQHKLSAQLSQDNLYSTKQFAISDRGNIRGFKDLSLDGTTGVALNNTLMARRYTQQGYFFEPYVGLDGGVVSDDNDRFKGYGVTAGVNLGWGRTWQFSLESARGYMLQKDQPKQREEEITLTFRLMF